MSKLTWPLLLLCVALSVLYFVGKTGLQLFDYWRLSESVEVQVTNWEVETLGPDSYALIGHYGFGQSRLPGLLRNEIAAKEKAQALENQMFTVWVSPNDSSHSQLEKRFPVKSCIYTAILLGVLLYFVWLFTLQRKGDPGPRRGF